MYANGTNYVFTSRQGYLELYEYVDGSFVFRSNLWAGYQYNYSNNLKGKSVKYNPKPNEKSNQNPFGLW